MIEPSWTFRTHNCFRCARALEEDEKRYTIPLGGAEEGHYLNQVMAVAVCKSAIGNGSSGSWESTRTRKENTEILPRSLFAHGFPDFLYAKIYELK